MLLSIFLSFSEGQEFEKCFCLHAFKQAQSTPHKAIYQIMHALEWLQRKEKIISYVNIGTLKKQKHEKNLKVYAEKEKLI